MLISLVMT